MPAIPDPTATPHGPRYEGRALPRPDDEVVDQGLAFDVGTLVTRRRVLGLLGLGAGALGLAACSPGSGSATPSASASSGEIPDETAGPYPGDGSNGANVLENSGVVRSDIRSSIDGGATAAGVPMTLVLTILDMANDDAPFEGQAAYVWHCDQAGGYSLYSQGIEDETYLRGVQVTGADGTVTFTSVVPACYSGRWPHIHFEVYPGVDTITDASHAIATSQVALPQDVCDAVYATSGYEASVANLAAVSLDSDNVFGDDGDDGGALQLAEVTGDVTSGYTVQLTARVDTSTEPTGGAAPGGGPGDGGGPGGTPPSGAPPAPQG